MGRIPVDQGLGNLLAVPVALALSLLFGSGALGRFLGALVAMPFHEFGHALASWLSSRFAVPLPFFTIWHNDPSWLFGLGVAAALGWFGYHSWREQSRLGMGVAAALLLVQLTVSWFVPTELGQMLQILGGALGEILLTTLLLVAFHFRLPDRLRWDFWRWLLLLPAAFGLAHAVWLWHGAAEDLAQMPWGSALGDDSDGDMNRLVRDFGWQPTELVTFFTRASWLAVLTLVGFYALAVFRYRQADSGHEP